MDFTIQPDGSIVPDSGTVKRKDPLTWINTAARDATLDFDSLPFHNEHGKGRLDVPAGKRKTKQAHFNEDGRYQYSCSLATGPIASGAEVIIDGTGPTPPKKKKPAPKKKPVAKASAKKKPAAKKKPTPKKPVAKKKPVKKRK